MKTLQLVLKRKWYDMISSGYKTEEYREIKPYWEKRMVDYKAIKADIQAIMVRKLLMGRNLDVCRDYHKGYTHVVFYLGYAKNRPSMMFEVNEITIAKGKPEWGAEEGKEYFVIKLGKRIS